ncbi:MAG: hypothetical protein SOU09_05890 [Faecalimonas umbilicata]|uniref:hypothetical protein n=1 Tax=Faecalimonas umbilicata TaxID=1912855 RepID=UPI002A7536A5|nr:hypothetical protein [Faecalimonas umbilicata]MDY2761591.1 hypothetical protein [Faecalimonas umbilicata]
MADKENGLSVDYVDPLEGNFSLTESIAVLDRETDRKEKAMEMALSEEEYHQLSDEEREVRIGKVRETFQKTGADYIIRNMGELPALISKIEE